MHLTTFCWVYATNNVRTVSDGLLSVSELKEGLGRAGLEVLPPAVQEILDGVDTDGNGKIDYTEIEIRR